MDSRRLEENSVVEDTITDSGMGGGGGGFIEAIACATDAAIWLVDPEGGFLSRVNTDQRGGWVGSIEIPLYQEYKL